MALADGAQPATTAAPAACAEEAKAAVPADEQVRWSSSRSWAEVPSAAESLDSEPSLRVVSLNLLADCLTQGSIEPRKGPCPCPELLEPPDVGAVAYDNGGPGWASPNFTFRCESSQLTWKRRWPMLKRLILAENPDVIGLQELDLVKGVASSSGLAAGSKKKATYELCGHGVDVQRDLWEAGFDGVLAAKKGNASDGVGLFWRRSRLQGFGQTQRWTLAGSVHVAIAQRLRFVSAADITKGYDGEECSFLGLVTHLKAGVTKEAEHLRTRQAEALLRCIGGHRDVLLMADLNAHPRPFKGPCMATKGDEPVVVEAKAYPLVCETFRSAYAEVLSKENDFTCWGGLVDKEVRGTFDYVFARGPLLAARRVLQVPAAAEVLDIPERMPNPEYPSDHFLLAADFAVCLAAAAAAASAEPDLEPPSKRPRAGPA